MFGFFTKLAKNVFINFKQLSVNTAFESEKCLDKSKKIKAMPKGMSMIELLAASVILAIGLSAIILLQVETVRSSDVTNDANMASFLAESHVEWMRVIAPARVSTMDGETVKLTYSGLPCESGVTEPCYYIRTTTVVPGVPLTSAMAVKVKISWPESMPAAGQHDFNYYTVISKTGF